MERCLDGHRDRMRIHSFIYLTSIYRYLLCVTPSPSWALEMDHRQNRLNPLTLATSILMRIAVLTAYFIFLVSQLKKYLDVFVGAGR